MLYSLRTVVVWKRSRDGVNEIKMLGLTLKVTSMDRIRNEFIRRIKSKIFTNKSRDKLV